MDANATAGDERTHTSGVAPKTHKIGNIFLQKSADMICNEFGPLRMDPGGMDRVSDKEV